MESGSPVEEKKYGVVREALPHDSAVKHVTGDAAYVDDIREPSGTAHVAPGYAPIAAGRITGIDLEAVKKAPGVVAVLTGPFVGGVIPATIGLLLAREVRRELEAAGGFGLPRDVSRSFDRLVDVLHDGLTSRPGR